MAGRRHVGRYYVHIPLGDVTYGPYALKSAKDFARIGSQHGSPRLVLRAVGGARPELIRIYEAGVRTFPGTERQLKNLTRGEIPRKL